jgi:hypothetical protein
MALVSVFAIVALQLSHSMFALQQNRDLHTLE